MPPLRVPKGPHDRHVVTRDHGSAPPPSGAAGTPRRPRRRAPAPPPAHCRELDGMVQNVVTQSTAANPTPNALGRYTLESRDRASNCRQTLVQMPLPATTMPGCR
jgi:hypothetical protein